MECAVAASLCYACLQGRVKFGHRGAHDSALSPLVRRSSPSGEGRMRERASRRQQQTLLGEGSAQSTTPYPARYSCCFPRETPLTVFGPMAIGPACICRVSRRWNRQAVSFLPSSRHLSACPSHFELRTGSALARWRYISSIAWQSTFSLIEVPSIQWREFFLQKSQNEKTA